MKKGFTLIELLAVIVILAIIAVIATPIVLSIIDDSRISSLEVSSNMYKKAVENSIAIKTMNESVEDGIYTVDKEGNLKYKNKTIKVEIDNYKFDSGYVNINEGKITNIKLISGDKIIEDGKNQEFDVWDGSKKEVTPNENIYHITKASELAWIAQEVNSGNNFSGKTISLESNLDLNNKEWTPIGNSANAFSGIFEGNNYNVKNLKITKNKLDSTENKRLGLFGGSENASFHNLNIYGCNIIGYSNIGCLVGNATKTNINNINLQNANIESNTNTGILIGILNESNINNINVYDSKVVGMSQIGGVIAYSLNKSDCKNVNSYNSTVIGSSENIGGVFGIIIETNVDGAYSNSLVDNSVSESNLSCTGGIMGQAVTNSIIENLISETVVNGKSEVGGISGHVQGGVILNNVISYAVINAKQYVGGIIGIDTANNSITSLENIESYAEVIGETYVGGIVGMVSYGEHIYKNIYSKSKISGNTLIGGVIGGFSENETAMLKYKNIILDSEINNQSNKVLLFGNAPSGVIVEKLID